MAVDYGRASAMATSRVDPISVIAQDTVDPATQAETKLAGDIRQLFYLARDRRRPLVDQWMRNYSILRNRHWNRDTRPGWMPSPEIPEIFPIVATRVAWMTDQRPSFDVQPSALPFSPYYRFLSLLADDLKQVVDANWLNLEYDADVEQVVWDGEIYGTGIFKSEWDQTLDGGLGNANLRRVDPFTFYPDPQARTMDDALYFIEARGMSWQEVERRWPKSLKSLPQSWDDRTDEAPDQLSFGEMMHVPRVVAPGAIPPNTRASFTLPGTSSVSPTDTETVTVYECWLRTLKDGEDGWRCVVVAGNRVLLDKPATDLWSHGQHPYSRYVPFDLGEFWGFSMVELLAPSQRSFNRLLAAIEHNIYLVGNPILKEGIAAASERQKLTNQPGLRVTVNQVDQVEWLQPPQLPASGQAGDLLRFYIAEMERVSGVRGIVQGQQMTGRNSEGVVDSIAEAAFVRIRMSVRNLERSLRHANQLIAALVVEFFDKARIVAIVGPDGNRSSLALQGKHFYAPSDKGRIPMRYQLLVNAGSSLPTSRQARAAEADALFALGAIDEEALLEAHQFPNRYKIVPRVMHKKAMGLMVPPGARQRARAA